MAAGLVFDLVMCDSSDPEVELYEEVVRDMYQDTPLNTPNLGTVAVATR